MFTRFLLVLVSTASAAAQSVNIDIGSTTQGFGTPPSAHGAAAAQAGVWNETLGVAVLHFLDGGSGTTKMVGGGFGVVQANVDNPLTSGDDEKLMDDGWRLVGASSYYYVQINGLANGAYYVYTYALAPDATDVSVVTVNGSPDGPRTCGGAWPGAHVEGVTYTRHYLDLVAGGLNIRIAPQTTNGFIAGVQIVRIDEGVTERCFGSVATCPCGNAGQPDSGCENSLGTGGGRLVGSGAPRIAADTLSLSAAQLPPAVGVLFFQGTSALAGIAFGDGLRCAGGGVVRLATKTSIGGAANYPGPGDPAVSVGGHVTGPSTREYQAWYRNAAAFCTASTFNLTNGVSVLWQ